MWLTHLRNLNFIKYVPYCFNYRNSLYFWDLLVNINNKFENIQEISQKQMKTMDD